MRNPSQRPDADQRRHVNGDERPIYPLRLPRPPQSPRQQDAHPPQGRHKKSQGTTNHSRLLIESVASCGWPADARHPPARHTAHGCREPRRTVISEQRITSSSAASYSASASPSLRYKRKPRANDHSSPKKAFRRCPNRLKNMILKNTGAIFLLIASPWQRPSFGELLPRLHNFFSM